MLIQRKRIGEVKMMKRNKRNVIFFFFLVVFLLCSHGAVASDMEDRAEDGNTRRGYIFIGDSRFAALEQNCSISSIPDCFVLAKVSAGYRWMTDEAVFAAYDIMDSHPEITDWMIISGFGINDLHNGEKYAAAYQSLAEAAQVVVLSVNPVGKGSKIRDEEIVSFNEDMMQTEGIQYLDTYHFLQESGFYARDGVHYDAETNRRLWDMLWESLF